MGWEVMGWGVVGWGYGARGGMWGVWVMGSGWGKRGHRAPQDALMGRPWGRYGIWRSGPTDPKSMGQPDPKPHRLGTQDPKS